MNRPREEELLLSEVLAEGMPESLREDLLRQTLRQVRRRRQARQARRTLGALVVALGLGFLVWPRPHQPLVQPTSPRPYVLVETRPFRSGNIVNTARVESTNESASTPTVSIISTATAPHLAREIDDADLLSLAAPNPVVLVRLGPHSAELVFAHSPEQDAAEHQTEPQ